MIEYGSRAAMPDPDRIATREELAAALTALRRNAGLSVRDLVAVSGVPHGTVSGWMSGQHAPLGAYRERFQAVLCACGVSDPAQRERWWLAATRARQAPAVRAADRRPPYQGLQPFEPDDSAWFFGRERLVERALHELTRLAGRTDGPPAIMTVLGPSGSGKSSLIRAGIVPAIGRPTRESADSVLSHWHSVLLTPGPEPGHTLSNLTLRPQTVLCIDQFEELWTECSAEQERREFLRSLQILATPVQTHIVVIGLRADFYAAAARQPELAQPLQDCQILVGPMTTDELQKAIVEPARHAGARVDDELVKVLLGDLASRSVSSAHDLGSLPLLSHALLATWQRSNGRRLTVADYFTTGGISGAIEQAAENTYQSLTPAQRVQAQHLLFRMVSIDGETATRRRVQLSEVFGDDDPADHDKQVVLDAFSDARLLTRHVDAVEITHEALITAWPRLNEWITTSRAGLIMHRQVTMAARRWENSGRDDSALLPPPRLTGYLQWARGEEQAAQLNRLESEFLQASEDLSRRQTDEAERLSRSRRRRTRTALVVGVLGALIGLLGAVGYLQARRQQALITADRNQARSRQVAAEAQRLRTADPSLAAQLAVTAYRISPTLEAGSALLDATAISPGHAVASGAGGDAGTGVELSTSVDRRLLVEAITGAQPSIRLFDVGQLPVPSPRAAVSSSAGDQLVGVQALSADGTRLAAGTRGGRVVVWRVGARRPTLVTTLGPAPADRSSGPSARPVRALAVDSHAVLSVDGADGYAALRSLDGDATPVRLTSGAPALDVALSPDSRLAAVAAADGSIRLWNLSRPGPPSASGTIRQPGAPVEGVGFDPSGTMVAAGSADGTLALWDVRQPGNPRVLGSVAGPPGTVRSLAFSADGRQIAVTGGDGRLWVFDLATPSAPRASVVLEAYGAPVKAASFANQDSRLIGTGPGATLTVWSTAPDLAARQVCADRRGAISPADWQRFLPGIPAFDPCR